MTEPTPLPLPTPGPAPRGGRPLRRLVWPLVVVVTIFFASGQGQVAAPGFVPSVDKIGHFAVFGLLATLVLRIFFDERRPVRTALIAALCVSGYGIADEFRQSFTPGRSVEVADWVADTLGALVATAAYSFWPAWRRWLERPVLGRRQGKASSIVAPVAASVEADSAR